MKPFAGFKSEAKSKSYEQLPEGPYVATIKATRIDGREPDQSLIIRVDVSEGQYAGYFTKRWKHDKDSNTRYEPKYKGDFRLRIPNEGSAYYENNLAKFNDAIYRIEQSNPGYHWDWNENGLVGLTVGINMQKNFYNDNPYTKIGRLEIADDVRKGIVNVMKAGEPRSDAYEPPVQQVDSQSGFMVVNTDEVPF